MIEEKEKIIFLDSHKIFLSLEFLKNEERECLTEYGSGLLNGLLDRDTFHKLPVVHKKHYDEVIKENKELKHELEYVKQKYNSILRSSNKKKYKFFKLIHKSL